MKKILFRAAKVIIGTLFFLVMGIPVGLCILAATVVALSAYVIKGKIWVPDWLIEKNYFMDWFFETMDAINDYGETK